MASHANRFSTVLTVFDGFPRRQAIDFLEKSKATRRAPFKTVKTVLLMGARHSNGAHGLNE